MSDVADDPRCPECGEPIGQTATYCMHCSADLTEEREAADADGDGAWDQAEPKEQSAGSGATATETGSTDPWNAGESSDTVRSSSITTGEAPEQMLDPDGLVDNTLTAVVGILGGIVVGFVGTFVLLIMTESGWGALFGLVAWLGSTAYLVRRRSVQGAIAKSCYAVAVVLLLVPLVALSPFLTVDGGLGERGGLFVTLLLFTAVPAVVAAAVGWVASQFVPGDAGGSEG